MFTFLEMLALVESESSFGAYVCQGRVVYRQTKKGEEVRGFTTVRGAPSKWRRPNLSAAGRTTGNPMLCYAGERLAVVFRVFLRGSGSFGSTVTNISGSTGYLTSETN